MENKAELEANVRKATEAASRKRVVKVKGKRVNSHKKDDKPAGRRMVVKKGRRREPNHKKTGQAATLSIVKVSSSSKTVPLGKFR